MLITIFLSIAAAYYAARRIQGLALLAPVVLGSAVVAAVIAGVVRTALGDSPGVVAVDAVINTVIGVIAAAITAWNVRRNARKQKVVQAVKEKEKALDAAEGVLIAKLLAGMPVAAELSDQALSQQPERAYSIRQMSTEEIAERVRSNYFSDEALPVVAGILKERI